MTARIRPRLIAHSPGLALLRRSAFGIVVIATTSCSWGTRPWTYPPAQGPVGARVAVRVQGERADRLGELYACDSTGVTLRGERIVRIAWPRLAAMDVAGLGPTYDVRWGETVTAGKRGRLALVSRFPQGLQGDVLARVLVAARQDAIEDIP